MYIFFFHALLIVLYDKNYYLSKTITAKRCLHNCKWLELLIHGILIGAVKLFLAASDKEKKQGQSLVGSHFHKWFLKILLKHVFSARGLDAWWCLNKFYQHLKIRIK